jgi:hypothetical protein
MEGSKTLSLSDCWHFMELLLLHFVTENAGVAFCVSCRHLSTVSKTLVLRSVCHAGI